ncbi:hypothetical protein Bbelb_136680 [Branchiostoma belcheri]|nr:hypothetical protein Bbelb_136680 [Branchiostoma belcheri]
MAGLCDARASEPDMHIDRAGAAGEDITVAFLLMTYSRIAGQKQSSSNQILIIRSSQLSGGISAILARHYADVPKVRTLSIPPPQVLKGPLPTEAKIILRLHGMTKPLKLSQFMLELISLPPESAFLFPLTCFEVDDTITQRQSTDHRRMPDRPDRVMHKPGHEESGMGNKNQQDLSTILQPRSLVRVKPFEDQP